MLKIVKTTPNLLYEAQNELPESYIKVQEKKHTFIEKRCKNTIFSLYFNYN